MTKQNNIECLFYLDLTNLHQSTIKERLFTQEILIGAQSREHDCHVPLTLKINRFAAKKLIDAFSTLKTQIDKHIKNKEILNESREKEQD